jgi:hypothetical protein
VVVLMPLSLAMDDCELDSGGGGRGIIAFKID